MAKKTKKKFTKELGNLVCDLMEQGLTLDKVCAEMNKKFRATEPGDYYKPHTILAWKRGNKDFLEDYKVAQESRQELWVDQMMDIASSHFQSTTPEEFRKESERRRQMIGVIRDTAKTLAPKIYGDKLAVTHDLAPMFVLKNYHAPELEVTPIDGEIIKDA